MSGESKFHLVLIFDTELRALADALRRFEDAYAATGTADGKLLREYIEAGHAALYHLAYPTDDGLPVVTIASCPRPPRTAPDTPRGGEPDKREAPDA